jgi:ABC-2 type transport system permease protein
MEAIATVPKRVKINRFLPYWAVFQADVKQTLRSWIYRAWVLLSLGTAAGFLLYRFGAKQVAGIIPPVPEMVGDLLSWTVWGSVTLIIVLTGGAICSERGMMADAVLSRGTSRFQYFLGKWHARLVTILGTFFVLALVAVVGSLFLLQSENLALSGCLVALLTVAALLVVVVTCGVAISAVANSTLVSIAVLWMVLYGTGFVLSLLPATFPSPDRALQALPSILRGHYDWLLLSRMISYALGASVLVALVGMFFFSRKDV